MAKIKESTCLYTDSLKKTFLSALRCLPFGKGMQLQEPINLIAYVFKKGPFAKKLLYDTVIGIDSSDLAETIRRERLGKQHESRYHYNKFAYHMGPEKDLEEALWNR